MRFPLALSTVFLVVSPASLAADIITGPVDKAGFQLLIDGASPGDRILCEGGEYDFRAPGAVLITMGIEILAMDPSAPPLFVGDTTDGLPDGPLVSGTDAITGNTGFLLPTGAVVQGLRMEDLEFAGFERAFLSIVGFDSVACAPNALGSVTDLVLVRNYMRNCWRGIQVFGSVNGFVITDNYIDCGGVLTAHGGATPVGIAGDGIGCAAGPVALRPVANGTIRRNILIAGADDHAAGLLVFGAPATRIENNAVIGGTLGGDAAGLVLGDRRAFFGPVAAPIDLGVVRDNFITGNPDAPTVVLVGPSPMICLVERNTIGGGLFNVLLTQEANGFELSRNMLLGPVGLANIVIESDSYNNTVAVQIPTIVRNFGVGNTVTYH